MPVPSPAFGWANTPSGLPIPLSATESFQSVPDTSYATVICPSFVFSLNACFSEFITSSVTINPRLSALAQVELPPCRAPSKRSTERHQSLNARAPHRAWTDRAAFPSTQCPPTREDVAAQLQPI